MVAGLFEEIRGAVSRGDRAILATVTSGHDIGSATLLASDGSSLAGPVPPAAVVSAAQRSLESGKPGIVEEDDVTWFVEPVLPPPRMIIVGAIAVTDALVPMAKAAGWDVSVIDSRDWLAVEGRYPDAASVHCGEPAAIFDEIPIDPSTAVVSFLHEANSEDQVLITALRSPAAYVGSMGSRRTTARKVGRLTEAGLTPAQLGRLHAPIGLDIGAANPREIAVAVLAEIVAATRGIAYTSKPRPS